MLIPGLPPKKALYECYQLLSACPLSIFFPPSMMHHHAQRAHKDHEWPFTEGGGGDGGKQSGFVNSPPTTI